MDLLMVLGRLIPLWASFAKGRTFNLLTENLAVVMKAGTGWP